MSRIRLYLHEDTIKVSLIKALRNAGLDVVIESKTKPTVQQAMELYRVCQQLTEMYVPIYVVRIDARTGNLIVIAGEEIQVEIYPNGEVSYP